MKPKSRQWLISAGLSCLMTLCVGMGFVAGRYSVIRTFAAPIEEFSRSFTLGSLLNKEEKETISRAYYDGEEISRRLNDISWAVPNVPTPFVGCAPTPGIHRGARINSMQFRSDREVPVPKPDHTFRIFITGGSAAYSSGAPDQNRTIAGYLSAMLTREVTPLTRLNYEVFTMANPAWASTQERIVIENRLSELEPDLVISFSGVNDVHWGQLGQNVLWFRSYADDLFQGLVSKAYALAGQPLPEIIHPAAGEIPPDLVAKRLAKNVRLSANALLSEGTSYVFALQPALAITRKGLTAREQGYVKHQDYFQQCYARMDSALGNFQAENFTYLNLADIFDQMVDKEDVFLDSYHFGDKGNEIIARQIYRHLRPILIQ